MWHNPGVSEDDPGGPRVRVDLSGSDLDEAVAVFEGAYGGGSWDANTTGQSFAWRQTATGDGTMTLRTTQFHGRVAGRMEPAHDYVVFWSPHGSGVYDTTNGAQPLSASMPVMMPTDRPASFDVSDVDQKLVHFHKPFLERIAREHHGTSAGTLHLDTTLEPSSGSIRSWRNTLALVSRTVKDDDASPVLKAEMSRIAGIALLGMFPPRILDLPPSLAEPGAARIRGAVEFIHQNCQLPITTTMIAAAGDLSLRALQEGFRRHLEQTPNTYLRNVRLDRVREELATGAAGTLTQTARAWGFPHVGRFMIAYTDRFGEPPTTGR